MNNYRGILNLVTTHIGNLSDLTIRACKTISNSDIIYFEEEKTGRFFVKIFGLENDFRLINEHNETESTEEIIEFLNDGKNVSVISDCGTPGFADPGNLLIRRCNEENIKINFIHGPNSILTSIICTGFDISRFYYAGFLSPKKDKRLLELKIISEIEIPVIIIDTPYRLMTLLDDLNKTIPSRDATLCINMTTSSEKILRGKPSEIIKKISEFYNTTKLKAEFVLILDKIKL